MATYVYQTLPGWRPWRSEDVTTRIRRQAQRGTEESVVGEYHIDWRSVTEPMEIANDEVVVRVLPYDRLPPDEQYQAHQALSMDDHVEGYGRVTAHLRKFGATLPLEMDDPRVVAILHAQEIPWRILQAMGEGDDDSERD